MTTGSPPILPLLEGPRVRLRRITSADVGAVYDVFSNQEVARYWSRPAMTSLEEAEALIGEIEAYLGKGDFFQWGVVRKEDDRLLGTCTLFHLVPKHRRGEVGYALGRSYWGQGYMFEALSAVLEFAFLELDLHRLEADVDPRNQPSIRILERFGFAREGLLRERWHVAGEICDALFFGLLRPEWDAWRS